MPDPSPESNGWPKITRLDPRLSVLVAGIIVVLAWAAVIAIDLWNFAGLGDAMFRPVWHHLFNNRPVEWVQWLFLAVAILVYGYIAARVHDRYPGASSFFLVFGAALGLMLIEEAGDVRHVLSSYVRDHVGEEIFGLPYQTVSDVPFFALLAVLPIYALVRYGRHVWRARRLRRYLTAGVALYAIAALGSGLRHLGDSYIRAGRWMDETLMGGRWPIRPGLTQDQAHFLVMDGAVEESIELFAAACILAVALAFTRELRRRQLPPEGVFAGRLETLSS